MAIYYYWYLQSVRCKLVAQNITSFWLSLLYILINSFQKIPEIENCTVIKYENIQNRATNPGSHNDHQRATGLYEPVNGQPETPISVIGTKGQGQYDNIQHYENSSSDKNEKKNVYEDLHMTVDDHPYADMEVK